MIVIKSASDLEKMRIACKISAGALRVAGEALKVGATTEHIDTVVKRFIVQHGAVPSFLGYGGFPASICISINDEVIHGIPSPATKLCDGDIVSIDVGALYEGFHGDNAKTFIIGSTDARATQLIEATEQSLKLAIEKVRPDGRLGDIGAAVQNHVESHGFSVVRDFVGHGVGSNLHEEPQIPNYGTPGRGTRLRPGMTLAIEPMINEGTGNVVVESDGWTVKTADGGRSAHFEHTVLVTQTGYEILTVE